ncbi:la-related protein 6C-like [Gossypium australe]|uniref:La-related protein 6C-like n=1 Tax=Gossypium australe TaxID=47621 RepID=A0A5B6VG45_9ROSI|nr:la-related protein 6C-like [Gossypium australe]
MEESQKTKREEPKEKLQMDNNGGSSNGVRFKFNAYAPEFVSRWRTQMLPVSSYYYPFFHYLNGGDGGSDGGGFDWFFVGEQESITATYFISNHNILNPNFYPKNVLTDELRSKIIKQVEYQFSDMSLLANESLSKQISKDPEGYVPISFISSTKKIKSLISNKQLLAKVLRSSSKLVVSDDGKKVKRKHPFTNKDKEEVQSRTVVVENLPEDHSRQNLDKFFNVVGSVKNIQICRPQESNSPRSKTDFSTSNKLYTLVEFESREIAKKATEDNGVGSKKGGVNHNRRGQLPTSPRPINPTTQCEASMKQTFKGPRIPDGTKGFTMGRGKPLTSYLE